MPDTKKPQKRASLAQAMQATQQKPQAQPQVALAENLPDELSAPTPAQKRTRAPKGSSAAATSREGTRMLGAHINEPAQRQFKVMCAENDKTVQDTVVEAINDIFRKYGKEPIA